MLKAYLSTKPPSFSAFMIRNTAILAQKPRRQQIILASFLGHVGGRKWPGDEAKTVPCALTLL